MAPRSSCAAPGRPASRLGGASVSKAATMWARATSTGSGAAKRAATTRPPSTSATRAVPRAGPRPDDLGLGRGEERPGEGGPVVGRARRRRARRASRSRSARAPSSRCGRRPGAADGEAVPGGGVAADLGRGPPSAPAGPSAGRSRRGPGVDAGGGGELARPVHRHEDAARPAPVGDERADQRPAVRARHLDEVGRADAARRGVLGVDFGERLGDVLAEPRRRGRCGSSCATGRGPGRC